jgi:hypothetical protein
MAKAEIAKAPDTTRPRDLFSVIRSEMDRMFERFESTAFPASPTRFSATAAASCCRTSPCARMPDASFPPSIEAVVDGRVRPVTLGQIAPANLQARLAAPQ